MMNAVEGEPARRIDASILDRRTGTGTAIGAMAGHVNRARTDCGCVADSSWLETALAWLEGQIASLNVSSNAPERHCTGSSRRIPFQTLEKKTALPADRLAAGRPPPRGCCRGEG